jgi:hypothetical protein
VGSSFSVSAASVGSVSDSKSFHSSSDLLSDRYPQKIPSSSDSEFMRTIVLDGPGSFPGSTGVPVAARDSFTPVFETFKKAGKGSRGWVKNPRNLIACPLNWTALVSFLLQLARGPS